MSEKEINEDNCVLKVSELAWIDRAFESVLDDVKFSDRQYVTDTLKTTFQKVQKLNDMAKQAKTRKILIWDGEKAHQLAKEKGK